MTTLVKIAITLTLSLLFASCGLDFSTGEKGNGNIKKQTRKVDKEFSSISASEGLNVYITQADDFSIKVEADENIIELIGTDIQDNVLNIHAIKNIGYGTKNIYVSLPKITSLESSSAANLQVKNTINAEQLAIGTSSGGNLSAEIATKNLSIDASSGSNITITGNTKNNNVVASSGANIHASDLISETCNARSSSGANIDINVSQSLTTNVSSGGDISYSGNAKVSSN